MAIDLQQGIYHSPTSQPSNSFAVVLLRAIDSSEPGRIRHTLANLWKMYLNLKKGFVADLSMKTKNPHHGNLSILVGYGPKIFEINGVKRARPSYLTSQWLFRQPTVGGGPILEGIGLKYANDIISNEISNDHVIIQFIGDNQLVTHRAVVETWKALRRIEIDASAAPMIMRSFYTGFNRPDRRGWLGFHDGLSNIKSSDRLEAIVIDKKDLDPPDYWTANGGTYMAFLRITVDLDIWESIPVKEQERIVGRQKTTGCPLIKIDENDNNIPAKGCPVRGTYEITEEENKSFREYPMNNLQKKIYRNSNTSLENSHIARALKTYKKTNTANISDRIFRQSYEFLEPLENYPFFRTGLNFVSFQRGTDRLFRILKYGLGRTNFGGNPENPIPGTDRLFLVRAAGLFLVPPFQKGEEFPGEVIFTEQTKVSPHERRPYIRYM
jgi:deferrochelatase/peroxidase EfeB